MKDDRLHLLHVNECIHYIQEFTAHAVKEQGLQAAQFSVIIRTFQPISSGISVSGKRESRAPTLGNTQQVFPPSFDFADRFRPPTEPGGSFPDQNSCLEFRGDRGSQRFRLVIFQVLHKEVQDSDLPAVQFAPDVQRRGSRTFSRHCGSGIVFVFAVDEFAQESVVFSEFSGDAGQVGVLGSLVRFHRCSL